MAARRLLLIVNPRGGRRRGDAILRQVEPIFAAANIELEVHRTKHPGHAAELAHRLDLAGRDGLCLIGGDGTLHEVVNGLLRREQPASIPIGIIPAGTGNSVLLHLGCTDPRQAAQRIVAGNVTPIDVARLESSGRTEYCLNIIGWGCVVQMTRAAERMRFLGPPRYALAALWQVLTARAKRLQLLLDGAALEDDFLFVVACNTRFTGKGMLLAPQAQLDDGKIDVVMVRQATRRQLVALFRRVFNGSHLALPCVECRQVHAFSLRSAACDPLNLDGELKGYTPCSVEMLPAALRLFA